jgi:competence protein ComEC
MSWRAMPFLRLLIPFALGIWAGKLAPAPWTVEACVCLGAVLPLLWLADRSRHGLARRAASWAIPFYLLLLGHLCQGVNEPRWKVDYFAAAAMRWDKAGGRVLESQAREDRYRVVLGIRAIGAGDEEWRRASGKLLLYLPKDFFPQAPRLGDTLWAQGRIAPIEAPLNPEAFDVSRFYAGRGIFHQMYVGVESVWWRPSERSAGLIAWVQARRVAGLETLRRRLPTLETFGVGAALTLGYRDELDVAVRDAYAASGVIHVLAVSGLHVGLVYLALGFFFQRAPRRMFWLGGLLQGMGVWAFVLIAGAPASAVRAGAMLSFFLFGRLLSRSGQPFNTMAAAAFCSLCFCPRWLFEPGFQLSYAAVAGIVAWQSDIYRWVVFRWAPLDYLWKLTSVGLAAQLATFPLSAYYFHQFPVYFWLSGLVAAPAAMLLLGAGLALLLLDGVVWLGPLIGKLLFWALSAFNAFVFWIESLPFSRLAGIWLPASAVACCYTGFILATIGLRRRNTSLILLALSLLSILSLRYAWSSWQAHQQRQAVFYTIRGHTLVDFFQGRRRFYF